jgi:hypothetical protein
MHLHFLNGFPIVCWQLPFFYRTTADIFFYIDVDLHAHEAECQQDVRIHELLFFLDWKNKRKMSFPFVLPSLFRIFVGRKVV